MHRVSVREQWSLAKLHRVSVCKQWSPANCMGLVFANNGLLQNCMGLVFANNSLLQNCIGLMFANNGNIGSLEKALRRSLVGAFASARRRSRRLPEQEMRPARRKCNPHVGRVWRKRSYYGRKHSRRESPRRALRKWSSGPRLSSGSGFPRLARIRCAAIGAPARMARKKHACCGRIWRKRSYYRFWGRASERYSY